MSMNGPVLPLVGLEPIESRQGGVPIVIATSELASAPAVLKLHAPGDYTLLAADAGRVIISRDDSALTITVPAGLPLGFQCAIVQLGTGQVSITGSGATVSSRQSFTKTAGQNALVSLLSVAPNVFLLLGDGA